MCAHGAHRRTRTWQSDTASAWRRRVRSRLSTCAAGRGRRARTAGGGRAPAVHGSAAGRSGGR
eukprot:3677171-Prymnesium_polylepis.1